MSGALSWSEMFGLVSPGCAELHRFENETVFELIYTLNLF